MLQLEQMVNFVRDGYLFTSRTRSRAGRAPDSAQPVALRMLGRRAVLVRDEEGVRAFYDTDRMQRAGAMPAFIRTPLFGPGAVHALDDDAHAARKNALVDMAYDDERVERFQALVAEELETILEGWAHGGTGGTGGTAGTAGNVHEDTALAYGRAAFRWAQLPISDADAKRQTRRMHRLLDNFGRPARNPIAWFERYRLDRWAKDLIAGVRDGSIEAEPDSVLAHMADLRDEHGEQLDAHTAGVELQNLTRPTVAVARFAAFAATALLEHPEWIERIRAASSRAGDSLTDIPEAVAFAHEVRRTYPFVPMLPAKARQDTEISGCPVKKGQRVLLDFVGTLTSPNEWKDAGSFDPERFLDVDDVEDITVFIPQGGGDVRAGHRCPGEKIAVSALSAAVVALCRPNVRISGDTEDRTFPWTQMLTRPATGVRVSA